MKKILCSIVNLYSGPFQAPLVFAFTAVAAITIGIGALVISYTINNYLALAMDARIARDIHLAQTYYDLDLGEVQRISTQLAGRPALLNNIGMVSQGDAKAIAAIRERIQQENSETNLGSRLFIAVVTKQGDFISGSDIVSKSGDVVGSPVNWAELPVVARVLADGIPIASTEIIPVEYLEMIGLSESASIEMVDTPKTAAQLFDPREGSAGLVIIGISPIKTDSGQVAGVTLAFHLLNNDFTLVDQIRNTAGIDTVTIFLGDMRISTNVMTNENERAIGTRMAEEVSNVVLSKGQPYIGTAFVVNEDYITCYQPIYDHQNEVVGALYVGALKASFLQLLNMTDRRISLIATLTIVLTFILATPVSRYITRPLKELRDLTQVSRRVTQGDLEARAVLTAKGEVGKLAADFNNMLDTLQKTQDQLVHSEKLASLGQLAAGVAHELNNPLATILLYAETMAGECVEGDPDKTDLEIIVNETHRCKRIVADLLNFARQNQVIAQLTDLHGILDELISLVSAHFKEIPVRIEKDLDPELPCIEVDPSQLRQVFLYLMVNAMEAMPDGGRLTLRTRRGPEQMVTVEIEDTGIGISDDNLGKLFTPFFTTKPIGKGTGLGLAISYGIIKMHRGQIHVLSSPGKGTTFSITLPERMSFGGDQAVTLAQSKGS